MSEDVARHLGGRERRAEPLGGRAAYHPPRTLSHRKRRGESLTTDESDKLARVVRVAALAEETFQDEEKAHGWLRESNRALGGERPLDLLETEGGARLIE